MTRLSISEGNADGTRRQRGARRPPSETGLDDELIPYLERSALAIKGKAKGGVNTLMMP
jgi:hypothetical protein